MPSAWTADEVKALREEMGWTQEELARHLGVTHASVNRWENGHAAVSKLSAYRLDDLQRRILALPDDEQSAGEKSTM